MLASSSAFFLIALVYHVIVIGIVVVDLVILSVDLEHYNLLK
jgi:hypothetical protein